MEIRKVRGINASGLGPGDEADESLASNLVIEARLLTGEGRGDEAAALYARAAAITERMIGVCRDKGLVEYSWVQSYSAAQRHAAAGDAADALRVADDLLAQPGLPGRLRRAVAAFADTLRPAPAPAEEVAAPA